MKERKTEGIEQDSLRMMNFTQKETVSSYFPPRDSKKLFLETLFLTVEKTPRS